MSNISAGGVELFQPYCDIRFAADNSFRRPPLIFVFTRKILTNQKVACCGEK